MIGALQSAVSGMLANQFAFDVSVNNTANIHSIGFRSSRSLVTAGARAGAGASVGGTQIDLAQGPLMRTGVPSDLAIGGRGFFQVENADGQISYTRAGDFTQDAGGYLRLPTGERLMGDSGPIQIPPDSASYAIASDGTVRSMDGSGNPAVVGRVQLALFRGEAGMTQQGGGLFSSTETPSLAYPGSDGAGALQSGAVEMSNVDLAVETVDSMTAQRGFEANVATLRAADEMLRTLTDL